MTATTTNPTSAALACDMCGIAVKPPHRVRVAVDSWALEGAPAVRAMANFHRTVPMTRCDRCEQLRAEAAALAERFPSVRARLGAASIAQDVIAAALAALELAGHKRAITDERMLALALPRLARLGSSALFRSRFGPLWLAGAKADDSSSRRWAHVDDEHRADLREGYAELLRAVTDRPQQLACPSGGCLLCGIGSVVGLRTQLHRSWKPVAARRRVLGGRGEELVDGHLCPDCASAVEHVGSVGPTAMERSLLQHLGYKQRWAEPPTVNNLAAWGSKQREPNRERWAHLGSLKKLRKELDELG